MESPDVLQLLAGRIATLGRQASLNEAQRQAILGALLYLEERLLPAPAPEELGLVRQQLFQLLRADLIYFFQKALTRDYESPVVKGPPGQFRRVAITALKELGAFVFRAAGRNFSQMSLTENWYWRLSGGQKLMSMHTATDYFALLRHRLYSLAEDSPPAFRGAGDLSARLLSDESERPALADFYRAERLLLELLEAEAMQTSELKNERERALALRILRQSSEEFLQALHTEFASGAASLLGEQRVRVQRAEERSKALDGELRAAARIHRKNLQRELPSDDPRLQFALWYQPHGETDLSGDFYLVERLDRDEYAIVIADIAGHGLSGAIHLSALRAALEHRRGLLHRPEKLLHSLNRDLFGRLNDAFVTALALHMNLKDRRLRYCNAGHPKGFMVLRREDRTPVRFLRPNGRVLGAFAGSEYRHDDLWLEDRVRLVLYTDGLSESMAPGGDMLGERGLLGLFRGTTEMAPAAAMEQVRTELRLYQAGAPAEDDCTLLVADFQSLDKSATKARVDGLAKDKREDRKR
ncbi:MAG: serine/threonine-protein phosphatase [Leptospirales bacterium]|nr:serine/threonine-protein phosphatase [Leptospirales bacterium]